MAIQLDWLTLQQFLPKRASDSHKYDYGYSLLVGGNTGMPGAILLAGLGALRVGSGLVMVATHAEHAVLVPLYQPELMAHKITRSKDLQPLLAKASVIGIGPGLGQDRWAKMLFKTVLATDLPLIVDADALNLLAKQPCKRDNWILTPNAIEAARLLACSVEQIDQNREQAATQLQQKYGGVVVLKGQHTLVASVAQVAFCPAGNPGMASGGMGDLLTGIITGLVAQKLPLDAAAQLGVYLHGKAGDLAAEQGERGLLATDLLPYLPSLLNPQ